MRSIFGREILCALILGDVAENNLLRRRLHFLIPSLNVSAHKCIAIKATHQPRPHLLAAVAAGVVHLLILQIAAFAIGFNRLGALGIENVAAFRTRSGVGQNQRLTSWATLKRCGHVFERAPAANQLMDRMYLER